MTIALGGVIGAVVFLVAYSPALLDLTNFGWLMRGDSVWHFLGWHYFRHEPWQWPPGGVIGFGFPVGTSIGNTDSVPLLAFLLKPFDAWLPGIAQYIGPWLFACFVLQGVFATLLLRAVGAGRMAQVLGAGLFVCAPALAYRTGHAALAGHWLILAGLWVSLTSERRSRRGRLQAWACLCALSGFTHPYLSVMVAVLMLASYATIVWPDRGRFAAWRQGALDAAGALATLAACWWASGYFLVAGAGDLAAAGLGDYSFNLLSPVAPMGTSALLPEIALARTGQYEGFTYFGAGWLALTTTALVLLTTRRVPRPSYSGAWPAAIILLLVALSPVVTVGRHVVIDASAWAPAQLGMFRASGRFAWVAMYLGFAAVVGVIAAGLRGRAVVAVLAAALALQLGDLYPMYRGLHDRERDPAWTEWHTPLTSAGWDLALPNYRHLMLVPPDMCDSAAPVASYPAFALLAGRHHVTLNSGFAARYDAAKVVSYCGSIEGIITRGELRDDTVYVVGDAYWTTMSARDGDGLVCTTLDGYRTCVTGASYDAWRKPAASRGITFTPVRSR